jgi:hypothetical protein
MTRAKDISKIVTDADLSGTLDVTGTVTAGGLSVDNGAVSRLDIYSNGYNTILQESGSGSLYVSGDDIMFINSALSKPHAKMASNGDISFYEDTGTTPKLFWDASAERLGIGTSSPISALDLSGGADGTPQTITLAQGNATSKASEIVGTYTSTNEQGINFVINNFGQSTAMSLTSGGNLLVQTTSSSTPTGGVALRNTSDIGSISIGHISGTGSNNGYSFFKYAGITIGSITQSGTTAVAYNTSSDYRLKENVTADWDATTRLKQLNPVRFNFIADADTTVDGFLAHEVQSVVPEAISGTHNEVDADGNPVYQGIDQSKLVPLLVKTIQELEARIVALETA